MAKAKEELEYILDAKGRKKAVILPIRKYRRLMEDLRDLAAMSERENEPTVAWEEVKRRLKADGLLSN